MKSTLVVGGIECKTIVVEKLWHVIVEGEPQVLYKGWKKDKSGRNGRSRCLKLKQCCQICKKEFFGSIADPSKYCSISCGSKIRVKELNSKHISLSDNEELKQKARNWIGYRVDRGRIISPEICSNCGWRNDIIAHHPDYGKPNEIIWLCIYCHKKLHFGHDIKGELIVYNI